MLPIITATISGKTTNAVSARTLHSDLGFNKANYAKWIKSNVLNSAFALGYDYIASNHENSSCLYNTIHLLPEMEANNIKCRERTNYANNSKSSSTSYNNICTSIW